MKQQKTKCPECNGHGRVVYVEHTTTSGYEPTYYCKMCVGKGCVIALIDKDTND